MEAAVEQGAVGLQVDRGQDHERPEREEVRHTRHRPPQQRALPEHLDHLCAQPLAHLLCAVVGRLPRADQVVEPQRAPAGDRQRRHRHRQPEDQADHHEISSCLGELVGEPSSSSVSTAVGPTLRGGPAPVDRVVTFPALDGKSGRS